MKKKTYGIIGLGRFGTALAQKLASLGAEILVCDKNEAKVSEMREITENAFIANDLERKTLESMGYQNCDICVVCIGNAIDVSILTVMKLQSIGVKNIIAKATSVEHGEILKKIGAEIVFPEQDMGIRLANRLEIGLGMDFFELSESVKVAKINTPNEMVGKSVMDSGLRANFGLNIIAVESGGAVTNNVNPSYVFEKGDVIYICGSNEAMQSVSHWLIDFSK